MVVRGKKRNFVNLLVPALIVLGVFLIAFIVGNGGKFLPTGYVISGLGSGLIGYWNFDESSGAVASDSSGNGLTGTLQSNAAWTAGKVGGAGQLDGSGDFVNVPHNNALNAGTEVTISAWINADSLAAYNTIVQKGVNYGLQLGGSNPSELSFFFNNGGLIGHYTSGANIQTGRWYHVAATFNEATNEIKIYLDGANIYTDTQSLDMNTDTSDILIGNSGGSEYWDGALDDVRVYSRALTPVEIQQLYQFGTGPDITAPGRSNGAPSGILPFSVTSANISLSTDELAVCRYSTTPGTAYSSMTNVFSTTPGTSHSKIISVAQGQTYNYYIRCNDTSGNINGNDYSISFSVAVPAASYTVSVSNSGGGSITSSPAGINCPGTCSVSFTTSSTVTLNASANTNYTFNGWSGCDSTSGNTCTVLIDGAKSVSASFYSTSLSASFLPADRVPDARLSAPWSNVGIPGGIPTRNTICSTPQCNALNSMNNNGNTDVTATIQAAIDSAPVNTTVLLPNGIFRINGRLFIEKPITLRGAGAGSTTLNIIGNSGSYGHILFTNDRTRWKGNSYIINWVGGYKKGDTIITLQDASNIAVGQEIWLDELNDISIVNVDGNEGVNCCSGRGTGDEATWTGDGGNTRALVQINRVAAKNGNNITLEEPLHYTFKSTLTPQVMYWRTNSGANG